MVGQRWQALAYTRPEVYVADGDVEEDEEEEADEDGPLGDDARLLQQRRRVCQLPRSDPFLLVQRSSRAAYRTYTRVPEVDIVRIVLVIVLGDPVVAVPVCVGCDDRESPVAVGFSCRGITVAMTASAISPAPRDWL